YSNLFGQKLTSGLRGLNAGLARGVLRVPKEIDYQQNFDAHGIYVLPATTENLPPVAGIITAGKGNILSHVQLLARNLGIPNVAVDKRLLSKLASRNGQKVVLAVSSRGVVQLVEDDSQWDAIFAEQAKVQNVRIRPDLNKLDLYNHSFFSLQHLRAADSGRVAGPKAANLGELKHHFPRAVGEGVVIPFGLFRALLDQPLEVGGPSVFSWMQQQYTLIRSLKGQPQKQARATRGFLRRIRDWILNADPGEEFRLRLQETLFEIFGADGTYGVFVRSDTNVEDLPGFTGAGLNLTVPNVVGFDNILEAINRVWASPFTERAFSWRQAYMESPEHVYVSVLLQKSIPAEKSGVVVTVDVDSGQAGQLTIAVNEGVGGAVSGQTAEELRVNMENGRVRLMAQATEPLKRVLLKEGGMRKIAASGRESVLNQSEIQRLTEFARSVPNRFPMLKDAEGHPVPADIEFGFYNDELVLFQIRPFLESSQARQNIYLNRLDQNLKEKHFIIVDLDKIPVGEN
ncbi:MAG: phosphoenolpyruvate synthase, partial [Deltaproteobacteria bacterium]|nr:phosphoenolpyruvate synthase [Deltaproteobacteria bacterium]